MTTRDFIGHHLSKINTMYKATHTLKTTKPNVIVRIGKIQRFEKQVTKNKFLDEAKYPQ